MMSPQESLYAKITVVIGVIGIVVALLAWLHPFAPRSSATGMVETTTSLEPSVQPLDPHPSKSPVSPQNPGESHPPDPGKPPSEEIPADSTSKVIGGAQPHTARPDPAKPTRACNVPETATVRPGAPAQVASGLAVLSVRTAREGSEPYLMLGIASDRDALTKAVLGAPVRYLFATSRGAYFANVTDVDLKDGVMTVQVGCEAKESTP